MLMPNPEKHLSFSAQTLQAYVDCARRFELSSLEQLKWPAVESEPLLQSERHMVDGRRFHEMVHRDVLGMSVPVPDSGRDVDIARWWGNYQTQRPADVAGERFAEKTLVGSIGEHTVVATCDLIVIGDGQGASGFGSTDDDPMGSADGSSSARPASRRASGRIFDWKTWRRRHSRAWLAERLQTRIYPYLLAQAGAAIAGGESLSPDEIEMVYWYSDFPDDPEVFAYSEAQCSEDEAFLGGLVDEILARDAGQFPLTTDEKTCTFCVYRSFCDRGDVAGPLDDGDLESDEDAPPPLGDLDDYEAIAF